MKINMAATTTSCVEAQKIVGNLIKEFCEAHHIPFGSSIYNYLITDGVDRVANWSAAVKNLPFQHYIIRDELQTYGIIFDFEENKTLTTLLLKG